MENLQLIGKGRVAEVYDWGDGRVLKLFAVGYDAEAIASEARASQTVHDAGIPTPRAHGIVEVEGRLGIIFDRFFGNSMMGFLSAKPWKIFVYARMLADIQASMHKCNSENLPSQCEQLQHLITRAELPKALRLLAFNRLHKLPDGVSICHGDFHPGNVMIDGDDATIIDWTTVCKGNPVADFARTSLILQLGAPPVDTSLLTRTTIGVGREYFRMVYTARYRRVFHLRRHDIQPWIFPIAVARLGLNVTGERGQLVTLIEKLE